MHLTRREFLENFLGFVGELGDTTAYDLAAQELNRAITRLGNKHPWRVLRYSQPYQLQLVINQSRYPLEDWVADVGPGDQAIRNLSRNGQPIRRLRDGELLHVFPTAGSSFEVAGVPAAYELVGVCGAAAQPSTVGEAIEVLSDNAADGNDIVATVTGQDVNNDWVRSQVQLNGVVPVGLGTLKWIDELAKAYVATATPVTKLTSSRGNITFRTTAAQTLLQKLFPQESAREHPVLTVYPKPSAADVLAIPVMRKPKRLFHDSDPIPDAWEPALQEDLVLQWKVNRGELSPDSVARAPRPCLRDLIETDNLQRGAGRTAPYGGF
jgi:hypothetical protein